jgi:hypothetical protein
MIPPSSFISKPKYKIGETYKIFTSNKNTQDCNISDIYKNGTKFVYEVTYPVTDTMKAIVYIYEEDILERYKED